MNLFNKINKIISTALLGLVLFTVAAPAIAATIPVTVATFQTSLQASITSSATSFTLVTGTDKAGNTLSGYMCFNIDEGTSIEEFTCGSVSGTSVTSAIRGIDPVDGDLEVTALKKAHRRGASVKITNYPALGILGRILSGTETIPSAISYASGVTPSASGDLADKEYVLSVVSGGAVSFEKVVVTGIAGETLSAGNIVYLKASDSRWWKTSASASATSENVSIGVVQSSSTAGNSVNVLISGIDTNQSGLSANTVYYLSNTSGILTSSPGTKEVTAGIALSTTSIYLDVRFNQRLTEDEQDAISGGSTFGTPSNTNKFITQDYNSSATGLPVRTAYTTTGTQLGSSTTRFDITNTAGTTYRYTYDSTGTDPSFSAANNPVGSLIYFNCQNFTAANNGLFVVTGSSTNYVEVTNASGVAENDKTVGTGNLQRQTAANGTYAKSANLKYITVEQVGGGADGIAGGTNTSNAGGSSGAYAKKMIPAASLSSSEYFIVGAKLNDTAFRTSSSIVTTGARAGSGAAPGTAGTATGGDLNINGMYAAGGVSNSGNGSAALGGSTPIGMGGGSTTSNVGTNGTGYGSGGAGGGTSGSVGQAAGTGQQGIIIITEYFS